VIGFAGMASAFLYFYFRETGKEVSWKDFVNNYLARGLVRDRGYVYFSSLVTM
jgi:hypothetical protein